MQMKHIIKTPLVNGQNGDAEETDLFNWPLMEEVDLNGFQSLKRSVY